MEDAAVWTEEDEARANLIADIACEISEDENVVAMALDAYDARQWQPIETAPRIGHAIINEPRWGVCEGNRYDDGRWVVASFNGQSIEGHPTHWMPFPQPPLSPQERAE